jgi:hypothetical protein
MTDINNDYVGSLTVAQFIITMSVFEFYKVNLYILSVDPRTVTAMSLHSFWASNQFSHEGLF